MKNSVGKRPLQLAVDELVAQACKPELSRAKWSALFHLSKAWPAAFAELPTRREEIPPAPVADPFVSALRRLAWPSVRLPERHRKTIASFGEAPLSLLRLALEEANTRGWREQDAHGLARLVKWQASLHWEAAEFGSQAALLFRSRVYLVFCLNVSEPGLASRQQQRAARDMLQCFELCPKGNHADGDTLLAVALGYAKRLARPQASAALAEAARRLAGGSSEERTLLALVRAWVEGEYCFDLAKAGDLVNEAFETFDENADPWLAFFLHQEAARLAAKESRKSRECNIALLRPAPSLEKAIELGTEWVRQQPLELSEAAVAALGRVRRHLEVAAPLAPEFETAALRLRRLWNWGLALQLDEPEEGLRHLAEAFELVRARQDPRLEFQILEDILFFQARLKASSGSSHARA